MSNWWESSPIAEDVSGGAKGEDWWSVHPVDGSTKPVKQNTSIIGDTATDIKRGIEQLPGAVTGLADIINPMTYVTNQRGADTAANWIGDKTGFKPSQWAKDAEAEYSPERKASDQAITQAWDTGGIGDIAGSYLSNPRSVAGVVAQSLPSIVGGGVIARGAMKGITALGGVDMAALTHAAKMEGAAGEAARTTINRMATTASGIGEGGVTAGQNMDQVSRDADPRTAALTSAAAGIVTGKIGQVSGRVANRLGLPDVETAMAGGGLGTGGMPWYKRVPSSMVQESLLQELPQSAQEQVWQNIAEGKPWHEGVARQAIEGALAGAAMGGGVAAIPQGKLQNSAPVAEQPPIAGLLPAPANTGTPSDQVLQSEVERANQVAAAQANADRLYAERDAVDAARLPNAGPLSAAVNIGLDSGAVAPASTGMATATEVPTEQQSSVLRERDFVPSPAGSFGQMNEFADLVGNERSDVETRRDSLASRQQLQRDSALETTDARVAETRLKETSSKRDALLANVLDHLPEGQNPNRAFDRALRVLGFTDTTFRPEEKAKIESWKNLAPANQDQSIPEIIPSAPNELDPASVGIKERQPETPEDKRQRTIEANRQKFEQTRKAVAEKKAAAKPGQDVAGEKINREWTAFAPDTGTLGVPRADMPQIRTAHRGAMTNFMNARGIEHHSEQVPAQSLRPTQAEFSPNKVAKALGFIGSDRSILVSSDNYVLDGHHQWLAKRETGAPIKVIRLNAPIDKLIPLAHEFPSSKTAKGAAAPITQPGETNVTPSAQAVQTEEKRSEQQPATEIAHAASEQPTRSYPKGQATMLAAKLTRDGYPTEAYPHPSGDGNYALRKQEPNAESTPVKSAVQDIPQSNPSVTTEPQARRSIKPPMAPIMRRNDLVGAIMRVTGGRGIHSSMADTLIGEKANKVGGLRGLFTNRGQMDMGDLAMLLREEEGFDVRDASHLEEMIRDAASGNVARSMARQEEDKSDEQEKKYRDEIRTKARKFGIKIVAVKFSELEKRVLETLDQRRAKSIELLDSKSQERFNSMLDQAMSALPEEVVDETMADVSRRGLHGRDFWNESSKILRGMVYDAGQETHNEPAQSDASAGNAQSDGRGITATGRGNAAEPGDQAQPVQSTTGSAAEEVAPTLELAGQTTAEVRAQEAKRKADEEAAKRSEQDNSPKVTSDQVDLFNTQGGLFNSNREVSAPERSQEVSSAQKETQSLLSKLAEDVKPTIESTDGKVRIEDFGEKLGGAKKNKARSLKEALDREFSDEELASQPLSKIWPKPEIGDIENTFAAAFAHAARDEIPPKPHKGYKQQRWIGSVKGLRGIAAHIISLSEEKVRALALKDHLIAQRFMPKVDLLTQIDRSLWARVGDVAEYPDSYSYDKEGKQVKTPHVVVEIDRKNQWIAGGSVADVIDQVNALLGGEAQTKKMQFEVRGRGDSFSINKKGDSEYRKLKTFTTSKEALDFVKSGYDDLVSAWDSVKERDNVKEADVRGEENRPRTGQDWRKGQDATADQFSSQFGFRGVEFGNWVSQGKNAKERQGMLNQAYDALMDLANIVDVPPKALSLNGSLGLGFGSRGSGSASAHFEPSTLVINLTKTRGAGTLAHEWFHALDNYFSRQRGGEAKFTGDNDAYRRENYITYKPEPMYVHKTQRSAPMSKAILERMREQNPNAGYLKAENWQIDPNHPQGVRPEVEQSFADLVKALDESPMKARASMNDKAAEGYWSRIIERGARSFENYVISKMMENGYNNDYLANVREVSDFPRSKERYPYLLPEEVAPISEAFDNLFSTVEAKETDKGIALESRAIPSSKTSAAMAAPVRAIQGVVEKFKSTFKGAAALNIRVVSSVDDIPSQFRPSPFAEGVFHDDTGLVYLIADSMLRKGGMANTDRALQVLLHEAVGHFSLANMMGDRFKGIQRAVMQVARDSSVKKDIYAPGDQKYATVEAVRLRYPDASDTDVAQEVMARMAETGSTKLQMIRAMVRQWFRDMARAMGFNIDVTNDELNDLIAKASAHLREGKNLESEFEPSGLVAASRKGEPPARDRANIDTATRRMGKFVDAFVLNQVKEGDTQILGPTPAVLQAIGAKDIPLLVDGAMLKHVLLDRHQHLITPEMLKQIPSSIYDPLMIFDSPSETGAPGKLILTELVASDGSPVVAAVHIDKPGRISINRIASAYEWQNAALKVRGMVSSNRLEYYRNEKSLALSTTPGHLFLPEMVQSAQDSGINILTEADVVNSHGGKYSLGLESRSRVIGDSGRNYDQDQRSFFKNVGRDISPKNLSERTLDYLKNDFWKKMAIGLVDQFRGLRDLKDNGQAYLLARLSKGTAGAFDALLHHGKLSIKDGVYDGDTSGGFVDRLGIPLHGEIDDVLWWIAANRAEGLVAQGRENLFSPKDIATGKSLATGTTNFDYTIQTGPGKGTVTRNRQVIYQDALRVFNEFQKNTLDMAEQSGLIDGASRKYWESEFYVPFYRVSEDDGEFIGAKMGNALVRQQAFKKLKGGTDKLNSDLLSNTLLNWSHLIEASAKNRAATAALKAAGNIGAAQRVASTMAEYAQANGAMLSPGTKNTVWHMEKGGKVEYLVTDPFVMTAITSLEYAGMRNGIMDVMTKFKHFLTIGVTASPAFKVRNLIRDSLQAIGTSDLSYNPIKNVVEGFKQTKRDSQAYVSALASGGLIRFGTMLEGSESSRVRQLIKSGVKDSSILNSENKWRAFYDQYIDPGISAYNELGNRSEEINRAALYNQLVKQGKSHAEAALLARDLMDFSMQGSFNTIRFLSQVVPFFNARLQGMYKLGRAATDDPKKMAVVTGAVALASIALMAGYRDDDDWKRREDFDRDNFWWFKFGGIEYRIPKPFELGAVASLAERSMEYLTDDEMTGERFRKVVGALAMNNLSMNPVPQMIKPIIDLYANKDSFTNRPIETMGMEKLDSTMRFNSNTSMPARGLSSLTMGALSPVQYDHLVRSYFGWLGSFVVGGADMAYRAVSNEPTKPALDYFKFATQGILKEQGTGSSRYISMVYDQAAELEKVYGTYRQLLKDRKIDEAKVYGQDNADELRRYRSVEAIKRTEAKMNQNIHAIEIGDLPAEEKKVRIDRIQKMKERVAMKIAPGVQYGP